MTIINAADKDGDGSLSYEEFVKIMMGWSLLVKLFWLLIFINLLFVKYNILTCWEISSGTRMSEKFYIQIFTRKYRIR